MVPPARTTLRACSTTSLNLSAGFRRMYLIVTPALSSTERITLPSSRASVSESKNASTW
jgi:hypothetical protein